MEATEVHIKLMDCSSDRLQAFCSITFDDCFVVRDLKIIDGMSRPFVAMPSRKLTSHCPQCWCKNHFRAAFCRHCGLELKKRRNVPGFRWPRKVIRRHCPSERFSMPRDDSALRHSCIP